MSVYRSAVGADDFAPETRDYFAGRTVAVTGGSGFIGSHVVEQLLALGAQPIVPTRQAAPPFLSHLESDVEVRQADLADAGQASDGIAGAATILHLAASVGGIEYNATHPSTVFRANMRTFLNVMDAALAGGVERLMVTSSACIYPRHCQVPTPETEGFADWPEPTNAGYGWAKRMEEFVAQVTTEEQGLETAIARPYNAYGPRDNYNPESSHVLPALILKAFQSEDGTLPVWGDGSPTRSFLYVDDFARGLIEITARYAEADPLNIGADEEVSIGDAARMICEIIGAEHGTSIEPVFSPTNYSGQPRRNCDITKLKSKLGFAPQFGLRDGLERSVQWFVENRDPALTAHSQ